MVDEELICQILKRLDQLTEEVRALKEQVEKKQAAPAFTFEAPEYEKYIPEACKGCSNHPSNGGDGICHCILGGMNTITY